MSKKTKFTIAVSLIVQAITLSVVFIILCFKKKSISGAFLAVAAMSGTAGGFLLHKLKQEEKEEFDPEELLNCDDEIGLDECSDDVDEADIASALSSDDEPIKQHIEIPREDVVSDSEFELG